MPIQYDQANAQANEQANAQASDQANEHIITILNYTFIYLNNNTTILNNTFNYLNNNKKQKNPEKELGISENDKRAIVNILKRIDIYMPNAEELSKNYSTINLLELKIKYYAIKELYCSPYKVYLNDLTFDKLNLRFLKTKKYVNIENITHFINYFIKSLQEELYKGN